MSYWDDIKLDEPNEPKPVAPVRTAEQILSDASAGKLEAAQIKIKETARLTVTDMETGEVEERVISEVETTLDQII
jgi:hypothetical protein